MKVRNDVGPCYRAADRDTEAVTASLLLKAFLQRTFFGVDLNLKLGFKVVNVRLVYKPTVTVWHWHLPSAPSTASFYHLGLP